MKKAYINWSGGKDSALSLFRIQQSAQFEVADLVTTIISGEERVSMHGVRKNLLQMQADAAGLHLTTIELPSSPDNFTYERQMKATIVKMKEKGCSHAVFGDIFLKDLREYREKKLAGEDIGCVFPLWENNTASLMHEFIDAGFRAIIVCVNEKFLDRSFCGRELNDALLEELPPDVDPCGENGEYHSFVFDGPVFNRPVAFLTGEISYRIYNSPGDNTSDQSGFFYLDLEAR